MPTALHNSCHSLFRLQTQCNNCLGGSLGMLWLIIIAASMAGGMVEV